MAKLILLFLLLGNAFFAHTQLSFLELEVRRIPQPLLRDSLVDSWNQSLPGYQQLPEPVKELLYWTNYSRANPRRMWDSVIAPLLTVYPSLKGPESISLEAQLYRAAPIPLFSLHKTLVRTAGLHAADIAGSLAEPSHHSTNGASFNMRMQQAGIRNCATQNIAIGHHMLMSLALLYLDIRLPEMGHRKALLNPYLTEIGIGYAPYDRYGKDQFFIVQDMACRQ